MKEIHRTKLWKGIGMVLTLCLLAGWGAGPAGASPRPQEALAGMLASDGGGEKWGSPAWVAAGVAILQAYPQSLAQPSYTRGIIAEDVVNFRKGPGLTHTVIGQLTRGTAVQILQEDQGWYRIRLSDGRMGWVAQWLVEGVDGPVPSRGTPTNPNPTRPDLKDGNQGETDGKEDKVDSEDKKDPENKGNANSENTRVILTEEVVNLREGPGTHFPVVGQGSRGQAFTYLDQDKGWYKIALPGGGEGWVAGWLVFLQGPTVPVDPSHPLQGWSITLDPGHGNYNHQFDIIDQGARGRRGTWEKDVVMAISRQLGRILEEKGATVYYTRTGDLTKENSGVTTSADLLLRAQMANEIPTNLFVSVHANAAETSSLAGTSTYFYAPVNSDFEYQRGLRQKLAASVQKALVKATGRVDRGVREANFAVLRETLMPSILVETAYITNPTEELLLRDAEFQKKVAQGIAQGIVDYVMMPK